jgi:hypothetical protein
LVWQPILAIATLTPSPGLGQRCRVAAIHLPYGLPVKITVPRSTVAPLKVALLKVAPLKVAPLKVAPLKVVHRPRGRVSANVLPGAPAWASGGANTGEG